MVTFDNKVSLLPALTVVVTIIATAAVMHFRVEATAADLKKMQGQVTNVEQELARSRVEAAAAVERSRALGEKLDRLIFGVDKLTDKVDRLGSGKQ
jgi:hypothetical protein